MRTLGRKELHVSSEQDEVWCDWGQAVGGTEDLRGPDRSHASLPSWFQEGALLPS